MKITKNTTAVFMALLLLAVGNAVTAQNGYTKLIWSDEFNKDGMPDTSKWNFDIGRSCPDNCGWGNNELEYYTNNRNNSIVENGVLKIIALKEEKEGAQYTSAKLHTRGKFDFTYGRVEVRAKIPSGVGTWPAIWMLGSNITKVDWPASGEIDIMEHRGKDLNLMFGTLHYPGRSGEKADGNTKMFTNMTTEFHKYSLEWTEKAIRIFVDDTMIHEVANHKDIPFNHDFYLILNLAMGGNFTGPVDPAITKAIMEVDYVRVYQ